MTTWTDPAAPGWTLELETSTGTWTLSNGVSAKVIPSKWVLSTRHSPTVVWLGSVPVYVWTEQHAACASTLAGGLRFEGVFGGAPEPKRCTCGAIKTYGIGCAAGLHSRKCVMFEEWLRKEG